MGSFCVLPMCKPTAAAAVGNIMFVRPSIDTIASRGWVVDLADVAAAGLLLWVSCLSHVPASTAESRHLKQTAKIT